MKKESTDRLDRILQEASKLSLEEQRCVLEVIKGMTFTKNLIIGKMSRPAGV